MKATQIDSYGGPDRLIRRDVPSPVPGAGQVVVEIHATSLNPIDIALASGAMKDSVPLSFPWTPGADFSGVVRALADGVGALQIGDEVYGFSSTGGTYADEIAVAAATIGPKPRSLSHIEAASLGLVGQTALQALDAASLKSGQTILIHGGSGGVGSAAVQLAHGRGAHVVATAPPDSVAVVAALGADRVIDYQATPFETMVRDIDVVLDTIGGDTQRRSFAVLKPGGCLVALNQDPSPEEAAKYNVRTVMLDTQSTRASIDALTRQVDAGHIKPRIGKVYPIDDAAMIWRELPTLRVSGKIVFVVSG